MPCGGGGVLRRILLLLSCRAAGCMRGHGRGRTFVLVARAVGNCARRIDEGSLWNPPASGGVCGASCRSRTGVGGMRCCHHGCVRYGAMVGWGPTVGIVLFRLL